MSYKTILRDIEVMFATTTWTDTGIKMYPENYQGQIDDSSEFCRFALLFSTSNNYAYAGKKETSGLLMIRIFLRAGHGQVRLAEISDLLDTLLQNKKLTNGTELTTSYTSMGELDSANKSLIAARYSIPFKFYGD